MNHKHILSNSFVILLGPSTPFLNNTLFFYAIKPFIFLVREQKIREMKPSLCIQVYLLMGTLSPNFSLFTSELHHVIRLKSSCLCWFY